ncbi:MAG: hypothetical protein QOI24_1354 [Acidobacteriota bacterium]|nr:hypothetical protein [Acidobacteriota bacterium]
MSLEAAAEELARLGGVDRRRAAAAILRAAHDEVFRERLTQLAKKPALLHSLLLAEDEDAAVRQQPVDVIEELTRSIRAWAANGFGLVEPSTYFRRLEVCNSCPHYREPADDPLLTIAPWATDRRVCELCGCYMRLKARLTKQHCPAGKWEEEGR